MSLRTRARRHTRPLTVASAIALGTVLVTAGPAAAHVEVESERAQALAENVTIGFEAESESDTVGITELRVVLPEGPEYSIAVRRLPDAKGWRSRRCRPTATGVPTAGSSWAAARHRPRS